MQGVTAILPEEQFGGWAARPLNFRRLDGAGDAGRRQLLDAILAQRFLEEFRIAHIAVEVFGSVALARIVEAGMDDVAGGLTPAGQLAIHIHRRSARFVNQRHVRPSRDGHRRREHGVPIHVRALENRHSVAARHEPAGHMPCAIQRVALRRGDHEASAWARLVVTRPVGRQVSRPGPALSKH